jgi:hypothetical protein
MTKLLPTRLPISTENEVTSETYNRLVRVLEINLAEVDPENTRHRHYRTKRHVKF